MKTAALALAAFTGFSGGSAPSSLAPWATPVGWPDTWIRLDPRSSGLRTSLGEDGLAPEASASDEIATDLVLEDADPEPHIVLVGCELALTGSFGPEAWARDAWLDGPAGLAASASPFERFGAPAPAIFENGHTDKDGAWIDYEQIPRRPDRPESYRAYSYPLADAPVVSGYDLDRPDAEQRRGRMKAVGHGGVDLVAEMGHPSRSIRLEHQIGDAEVLYVGSLYGETVVTRHVVREAGSDRDYLLLFGHLDRAADGVRRGGGCRRVRRSASSETRPRPSSCTCTSRPAACATASTRGGSRGTPSTPASTRS